MGKPGGSSGGSNFKGTNGNDTFHVASLNELKTSTYDGGGGYDTLDLSALSTGITIGLAAEQTYKSSKSTLWPDHPFSGFYTDSLLSSAGEIAGSIHNIEKVIGTSGNDQIAVGNLGYADGGPGNDYVVGGTVVGGLGADYVNGTGPGYLDPAGTMETLVGGTYVNGVATGDHTTDWFEVDGSSAVILDFEVGTDKLILPNFNGDPSAIASATWQPTTYNGVASSVLSVNGQTIILAGVTPDSANSIEIGQFFSNSVSTMTSGPGDDIMWPSSGTSQLVFGPGSGNDIVTHFNTTDDHLIFTGGAPATWTNVSVNGEQAIQGYYDNGASSVTILGLTTDDVPHLLFGY
jgi:hypothetical protein